jgi:hypothetical protein
MWEDPIVMETRESRARLSAQFGDDLAALCVYLRDKEKDHLDRLVTLPPRRPELLEAGPIAKSSLGG